MAAAFVVFTDEEEEAAFAKAGDASVAKNSWAPAFDGNALVDADDEAAVCGVSQGGDPCESVLYRTRMVTCSVLLGRHAAAFLLFLIFVLPHGVRLSLRCRAPRHCTAGVSSRSRRPKNNSFALKVF